MVIEEGSRRRRGKKDPIRQLEFPIEQKPVQVCPNRKKLRYFKTEILRLLPFLDCLQVSVRVCFMNQPCVNVCCAKAGNRGGEWEKHWCRKKGRQKPLDAAPQLGTETHGATCCKDAIPAEQASECPGCTECRCYRKQWPQKARGGGDIWITFM